MIYKYEGKELTIIVLLDNYIFDSMNVDALFDSCSSHCTKDVRFHFTSPFSQIHFIETGESDLTLMTIVVPYVLHTLVQYCTGLKPV